MSNAADTLALAQRLRNDARETDLPSFARLFLRTAEELEDFVRAQEAALAVQTLRRAG